MDKRIKLTKEQEQAVRDFETAYQKLRGLNVLIGVEMDEDGFTENLLFLNNDSISVSAFDFVKREASEKEDYSEASDVGIDGDVLYIPKYNDVPKTDFHFDFSIDQEDWIGVAIPCTEEIRNYINKRAKAVELVTLKEELKALEDEANSRKTAIKRLESDLSELDAKEHALDILDKNTNKVKLSVTIGKAEKSDILHKVLDEKTFSPLFKKEVKELLDAVDSIDSVKNVWGEDNVRLQELMKKGFAVYRKALHQVDEEDLSQEQQDRLKEEIIKLKEKFLRKY